MSMHCKNKDSFCISFVALVHVFVNHHCHSDSTCGLIIQLSLKPHPLPTLVAPAVRDWFLLHCNLSRPIELIHVALYLLHAEHLVFGQLLPFPMHLGTLFTNS